MTYRLKGFTVIFDSNMRDDDAQSLLNSIQMINGVKSVTSICEPSESSHKSKEDILDSFIEWVVKHRAP